MGVAKLHDLVLGGGFAKFFEIGGDQVTDRLHHRGAGVAVLNGSLGSGVVGHRRRTSGCESGGGGPSLSAFLICVL